MRKHPYLPRYYRQRIHAKRRGIEWNLTFEEWLSAWEASGLLHKRGNRRGQYVMARVGDRGAYEEGNIRIITGAQNLREARLKEANNGSRKKCQKFANTM